MKRTPFHNVNLESGARMRELFGYVLPWEYAPGAAEEHLGTRTRASLCDLDYMGEFRIEGPDALRFVQRLLTRDCSGQRVGQIKYTTMCDEDGNLVDDGTIWRLSDAEFMLVSGDEDDCEWLQRNVRDDDVTVTNITSDWTTLALQGPKSRAIASKLTDIDLDALSYYCFAEGTVGGIECTIARMGYTGESGYEFHFSPQSAGPMWTHIMEAGTEFGIVPCGQAALESLRQEAGYLLVGNDHDKSTNPLEAGLGFTLAFNKDDFNGKQALLVIAEEGVKRHLVWFTVRGGEVARKGDAIHVNRRRIGEVTSGSYSPTSRAGTAIGYVLPQWAIPGIDCTLEIEGGSCAATLSTMALYDPGRQIRRGSLV